MFSLLKTRATRVPPACFPAPRPPRELGASPLGPNWSGPAVSGVPASWARAWLARDGTVVPDGRGTCRWIWLRVGSGGSVLGLRLRHGLGDRKGKRN